MFKKVNFNKILKAMNLVADKERPDGAKCDDLSLSMETDGSGMIFWHWEDDVDSYIQIVTLFEDILELEIWAEIVNDRIDE